jgi:hypothetical protein
LSALRLHGFAYRQANTINRGIRTDLHIVANLCDSAWGIPVALAIEGKAKTVSAEDRTGMISTRWPVRLRRRSLRGDECGSFADPAPRQSE